VRPDPVVVAWSTKEGRSPWAPPLSSLGAGPPHRPSLLFRWKNSFGLFVADDEENQLTIPSNQRSRFIDLDRDLGVYDPAVRPFLEAKTETLFTQLLFSYKLNPQTVLFLGYSDNRLGTQELDLSQRDRSFFFKVGYALVL
jgi:hypothetical protein